MNNAPRNTFVLTIAKMSKAFESFDAKICVIDKVAAAKIPIASKEKKLKLFEIIKNQNVKPAVTAIDLKRGDEISILYRINKSH